MQKNGKHREVKRHSRNTRTPSLDAVANWIVILERFDCLVGFDNKQRPLAIYYDYDKKKTMNICSDDSKRLMQNTVRLEYGITDIKELSKWTFNPSRNGMPPPITGESRRLYPKGTTMVQRNMETLHP
jgi:hypothetical protein